ncbi:hypothetical protein [Variovorax paradoxus]|uniref:hypothetical protein n=1 Tax=Variovorax paradoxus TaxID=34073 RepID=UPI0024813099|nr:hypothetical protein [Variovorax paradoxus]WGT64789.1 hypothetical protein QHG62_05460 [Variovorax paradoxus]
MNRITSFLWAVVTFFTPAWEIREEQEGAESSFCIYRRLFGRVTFVERWATLRTAGARLAELQGKVPAGNSVSADRIARAMAADVSEESATSPGARAYRGNRAREVLENESYAWAFHSLKTEIIESWQNAPAQDPQGRETLWLSLKLLDKIQFNLQTRLESGKLAQLELEHRAKLTKEEAAWLS